MGKNAKQTNFEKQAVRVSMVSMIGNGALAMLKLLAGFLANSSAMISDGINSASDIFSSIIVIIGVKLAARESDESHPYGHERFECVAAIVLAVVLLVTGLFMGVDAVEKIMAGTSQAIPVPGVLALIAAGISVVTKEVLYWYTRHYAKKLDSGALMATAWDHHSDVLSTLGAMVGIAGAMLGYPVFDAIASLFICAFIGKAAYDIFMDAVDKMVDHACSAEVEQKLSDCAARQTDVLGVDLIHTRVFANKIYVDIEIRADGTKTLLEGHEIAQSVHDAIEREFENVKHIMVHVNPV